MYQIVTSRARSNRCAVAGPVPFQRGDVDLTTIPVHRNNKAMKVDALNHGYELVFK